MGANSKDEMERIQRNLENFVDEDLAMLASQKKRESAPVDKKKIIRDTDELDVIEVNSEPVIQHRVEQPYRKLEAPRRPETPRKREQCMVQRPEGIEEEPTIKKEKNVKNKKNSKKKKSGKMKRTFLVLSFLLLLFIAGWYMLVSTVYDKMEYTPSENFATEPLKDDGVYNVLLIGSDSRTQGDEGRSDAMILLSISKKTKTIQMVSLLRDMYVEIPGHDGNRLNAAYSFGGPELLLETVKKNLDIEVNRYVVVNFQAFANLLDAVGGIKLELTNEEVQWVNAYLNEYNMLRNMPIDTDYLDTSLSGEIELNGAQALAYCRNRYIGTDFGRTDRQRKVLAAVIKKLPIAVATNPKELVNGLFPNLTTNLTKTECMRLSTQAGKLMTYELVQSSVPIEGSFSNANIRGMAVLQVDFEANKQYLRTQIYGY